MKETTPQSRRKTARKVLPAEVAFRRAGLSTYRTKIFDDSPEGCRIEFVERPRLGEIVWIKFDGLLALEATVRWVRGFQVGLQFNKPFYPAVFDAIILGQD